MQGALRPLLDSHRPSLHSCPECPANDTCVFVTPAYEPGYCLHEYRLLHAFLAQRLRAHPPAGANDFQRLSDAARRFIDRVRTERPFDPTRLHGPGLGVALPVPDLWPEQATLASFGLG